MDFKDFGEHLFKKEFNKYMDKKTKKTIKELLEKIKFDAEWAYLGEEEAQLIIRTNYIKKELEELEILIIEDREERKNLREILKKIDEERI
jgi:predicted molibdopterin-dependent oxidoreductase YjgC